MFLKRIELIGFKSFAQKTVLEFLPQCDTLGDTRHCGITAIVGPNGSGKSNVADAIRWVMGEQSLKSLRGKKSHDVIFAGGTGKARLGYAQVSLVFDNADKRIPIAFLEVAITRKVYRDGEGEYYINDSKVRLLDVIDLLAKSGIGKESYCVINQGMSDAVLNASAIDRRAIIEEAAGVKSYQIKRERSLKKLDITKKNLSQTQDLIREIEPRLRLLKRQAQRAQQREQIETELRGLQTHYYSWLLGKIRGEKNQAYILRESVGREVMQVQRKIDILLEEKQQKTLQLEDSQEQRLCESSLSSERQSLVVLEKARAILEGKIEVEKENEKNQRLIDVIPVDLRFVRGQLDAIRNKQKLLIQKLEHANTPEELYALKREVKNIHFEIESLYADCEKTTVERARDEDSIEAEKKIFHRKIEILESEYEKTENDIRHKEEKVQNLEDTIIGFSNERRLTNEKFFAIEREMHELERELSVMKDRHSDAKVECARYDVREEDIIREIHTELSLNSENLPEYEGTIVKEESEHMIARLKAKLLMIGGIDPAVADEFKETQNRYEFLSSETCDLEDAMKSLQDVIREMDSRIENEFSRAFESINIEFDRFFQIMFEGGKAELKKVLVEQSSELSLKEDDTSESLSVDQDDTEMQSENMRKEMGIDIFVYPPKKKINNLSMMSGGERSLVSLAVLFAVISYNPPPFSILDEVEAALDESNSSRFSALLADLSKKTQFIVITHNRETMRAAHVLYGVTMGNDGVSKLLSVKLDEISLEAISEKKEVKSF